MGVRTIYFRDEIEEKLKKEQNRSGLINDLLEKYFNNPQSKMSEEEIIEDVKKKIQANEEKVVEVEKDNEKEKEILRKYKLRKALMKEYSMENEEFLKAFESGEVKDYISFINSKLNQREVENKND
jgi:predicted restriction endonuclease